LLELAEEGSVNSLLHRGRRRHTSFSELYATLILNLLDQVPLRAIVESDAGPKLSGTCSSPCPVNVRLNLLGWLDLDDKFNLRNVETSAADIGCSQNLAATLFERLEDLLALELWEVAMHDLDDVLEQRTFLQALCLDLGLAEDENLAVLLAVYLD